MISDSRDGEQRIVIAIIGAVVVVLVVMAIGIGIWSSSMGRGASAPGQALPIQPPAATDLSAPPQLPVQGPTALSASEAATIAVESGIVKFYFASNKAELAPGSAAALDDLIAGTRSGGRLLISGFHDPTGDQARNIELARQRALAVHSILVSAGVSDSLIEVKKPEQMPGSGSAEEARRVEVSLVVVAKN